LYVPIDQLELIQPYIGMDDKKPKLSSLGGNEWEKAKQKTQQSVKQLAFDLVKLYAEREAQKGYKYAEDTQWQKEFEEAFPYEETPDQLQAIAEIKSDMESDKVMDRLLCGDVGYGKTEVAIRAAFKAVMDGKQVAILAPTTVLVQQHLKTISQRFDRFPVTVDSISRFKNATEQKATIRNIKAGNIDILIGTHRVLGKDIVFKDLGLLIVDEEQRFGVNHKETIKRMKNSVDVLTLSATPIPRTLHMSLVGIRDISTIQTPPQERIPVQTYVTEYSDALLRDVMLRELGRGGQVYFLYNRVKSMERMAKTLRELVPSAKILMAHGQMAGQILEKTMMEFCDGEYDVLICSTIIENGIDIPNVNTLIVHDADKFGLSQLYQLRGRVGRSNRAAYAYFTYDGQKMLTETAEKRLKAIKEFTEFGAGFKIAMRDLEIRGSGNIIGPEQHGHMSAVGYEMYCKLLEESVRELQGKEKQVEQKIQTNIDLALDAHIDDQYISNEKFRMDVYRKIAAIENEEDKMDLQDELIDRFGEYPTKTGYLLEIASLKVLASALMISDIIQRDKTITLQFKRKPEGKKIMEAMNENRNVFYYSSQRMKGEIRLKSTLSGPAIRTLTKILTTLS
jgi:transcription-repair coupling factor (superfamily II helicase)